MCQLWSLLQLLYFCKLIKHVHNTHLYTRTRFKTTDKQKCSVFLVLVVTSVVPENIHTPPSQWVFWFEPLSSGNFSLGLHFHFKILIFETPFPHTAGYPKILHGECRIFSGTTHLRICKMARVINIFSVNPRPSKPCKRNGDSERVLGK